MKNLHIFQCVVHQPKTIRRKSKHFHKPPKTVTEENKNFWKNDASLGGSICKDCYRKYECRPKSEQKRTETSRDENMVCKYLLS